jgi:signal peptidase I
MSQEKEKKFRFELPNWSNLFEEAKSLAIVVVIALAIRLFVYEPFYVPSGSMMDSLLVGDYVFATKFDYGYSNHSFWGAPNLFQGRVLSKDPARGDIIIFHLPHLENKLYVKRLIGLPGDKIQMKQGIVYINDKEVPRTYVGTYSEDGKTYNKYLETLPNGKKYHVLDLYDNTLGPEQGDYDNTPPYYVPEASYFFMGDNRDESGDSRVHMGPVDEKFLVAKVRIIAYSFAENLWRSDLSFTQQMKHIWTFITSFRSDRFFRSVDRI